MNSAKKHAEDQGGKIGHSYNLIKGFSYVHTPPGAARMPGCMFPNQYSSLTPTPHLQC